MLYVKSVSIVDGWRRHSGDLFVDELKTAIPWQQKSMLASGTGGAKNDDFINDHQFFAELLHTVLLAPDQPA